MPFLLRVLGLVALAAAVVTFLRTLLNLWLIPRLRSGATPPPEGALVTVIVPARDEQRTIERAVRGWLAQRYPSFEVIVVNDRSTDDTGAILARLAGAHPSLVVIDGAEPPAGWLGKPWALHQGVQRAAGTYLFFVDADLVYGPDTLAAATATLETSRAGMVALFPRMEMVGFWESVVMPSLMYTLFALLPTWLTNRTRTPFLGIGGGTGMLVRRELYRASGGHQSLRLAVVDDIGLARQLRRAGARTLVVRADDLGSLRMYHGGREVLAGCTKNFFAVYGRSYVMMAGWSVLAVICNLLPYGFAAAGDTVGIATVGLLTAARVILFRSFRYSMLSAVLGHPLMTAFWLVALLRSTWVTGIRGRLAWRGRTYDAGQVAREAQD